MINCPNCNHDNMIGAIFCRSCGEKINIDELRPEDVNQGVAKAKKLVSASVIRNVVMFAILAVLILILVGLFMKPKSGSPAGKSAPWSLPSHTLTEFTRSKTG